ncbi:MAG: non-canonical purine NTP pyrophosphatase, RdgB/HAM1 family [Candidatus Handelsmanbacteria bacterium RIFCSPLOWO2_12_FULL_64_10]|uniref:dITP/XTP pyrophosphatase n=1 Tax=Handelsmanbacteria sp. (strain RIFCSPLOWO2_12_FULL_64_10) TaxID=1817868 RepID=A0A1F6CFC3_HANXR|nr:MAG: non-canonical purine NTP pyrophosphatase, RdgB/HAM1 family [Candidatus Handelsmanbacteria bacterium RIFCSPLOWO2_12_FULL_64_10]
MTLVLATRNAHKVREIGQVLGGGLSLRSLADFEGFPEVPEEGETFEANAVRKATVVARALGLPAMADDSGLEVDALDGAPGVRSARFSADGATAEENNAKLLRMLKDAPEERRSARFRCVIAVAWPDGTVRTAEGACEGRIAEAPRGAGGFGYDPLFVPEGYGQTFAELGEEVKNRISHRARALRRARETILKTLEDAK